MLTLNLSEVARLASENATARKAEAEARKARKAAAPSGPARGAVKTARGSRVYGNAGTALPGGFSRSFVLEVLLEGPGVDSRTAKAIDAGYSSTLANIRARGNEIVIENGLYRFADARGAGILSDLPAEVASEVNAAFFAGDFSATLDTPEPTVEPGEAIPVVVPVPEKEAPKARVRRR